MASSARRDLHPRRSGGDLSPPPIVVTWLIPCSHRVRIQREDYSPLDVGVLVGLEEVDVLHLEHGAVPGPHTDQILACVTSIKALFFIQRLITSFYYLPA